MRTACILIALWICALQTSGQGFLDRRVSLRVHHQPLAQVLDTIARQGGFSFSYNSPILPQDSLVSVSVKDASVRQVLDKLLGADYQYIQREGYIIIVRQAAPSSSRDNTYTVTGYVLDAGTGKPLANASVYEREQLQSALTDERGFFQLRLRGRYREPTLGVSKAWYEDTTLALEPGKDREYRIGLRPGEITEITPLVIAATIEHSWWGRFCLSSRERIQSLNLTRFFTSKPYQVSLLPSIGTQGRMAPQVTNTVSLNLIGGYSAGTRGVEIAGAFNLDKRDVGLVQAAGLLNVAGGKVHGFQAAGLANSDLDSVTGVAAAGVANVVQRTVVGAQVAGVFNQSRGYVEGGQAAGVLNICGDSLEGVQISGVWNYCRRNVKGVQVAAAVNEGHGRVRGLQVSGLYNYASRLQGLQLGIVNVCDTSDGWSLGVLNIVKHGVHQLSVSYSDVSGFTVAYKGGTRTLYTLLSGSISPRPEGALFTTGLGLGTAFTLSGRWGMATELGEQQVFDQRWRYLGNIVSLSPSLTFRLSSTVSVFAGPRGSLYISPDHIPSGDYPGEVPPSGMLTAHWSSHGTGWIGGSVGFLFF
jgi:hypothetical protein